MPQQLSEIVAFAANLPGQVRGPKARLLPFPARAHYAVRLLDEQRDGLPAVVTLAEFSTRSAAPWRTHRHWDLSRGRANDVFLRWTIGNALSDTGLRLVDAAGLRFFVPRRARRLTIPVRLYVTPQGAPLVVIAAHIPTSRAASERTRRRICHGIMAYVRRCREVGLAVLVAGDFNGAHGYFATMDTGVAGDVQRIFGLGVRFARPGSITKAHGTVTDHRAGIPYVTVLIPVPVGRDGLHVLPKVRP